MNQLVAAAAQRQIVETEKRIAEQWALVGEFIASDRDASQASRTLRVLQKTLSLTREHLRILPSAEVPTISLGESGANCTAQVARLAANSLLVRGVVKRPSS